jgi:hypothetical protein
VGAEPMCSEQLWTDIVKTNVFTMAQGEGGYGKFRAPITR